MKPFLLPAFLLATLVAITAGCTNTNRILTTGLRVELTGIERASDGTVSVAWHVANSNVVSYLLSQTSHKIFLNGTFVGEIVDRQPLGLPASMNTGRTTKLTGMDAAATRVFAEALHQGSASYRVDSNFVVRIYDETVEKAVLSNSGTVPVTAK